MIYAIGDIHGRLEHLKALYDLILQDIEENNIFLEEEHTIVFLGDYINRGPKSLGVLDFLATRQNTRILTHIFLIGNHELFFIDAVQNAYYSASEHRFVSARDWVEFGGQAVLKEAFYTPDMDGFKKFLDSQEWVKYVNWLKNHTVMLYSTEDYVFVHGAIDPKCSEEKQDLDYVTMQRNRDAGTYSNYPKMVLHGHSPNADVIFDTNRIFVDVSASKDYGRTKLSAVVLLNKLALKSDIRVLDIIIQD